MKKQKQHISASIINSELDSSSPDKKRDRDDTLDELTKIPIKKQKIDQVKDFDSKMNTHSENIISNFNNSFGNNFQPTFNIYQNIVQMNQNKMNPTFYPNSGVQNANSYFSTYNKNTYNKFSTNQVYPTNYQHIQSHIDKTKFMMKDLPEVTVANYLQSKNVQEIYLNLIKTKKEGDDHSADQLQRMINSDIGNNKIPNFGKKEESGFSSAPSNINNTAFNQQPQPQNFTTITNFNIQNYNINNNSVNNNINITNNNYVIQKSNPEMIISGACKSSGFSESLNNYIQRAYERCKTEADIKICKTSLMKIIQAALKKGDLNTRNFNKFPLPILPTDEETPKIKIISENEKKIIERRKGKFDITIVKPKETNINIEEITKNINITGTCTDLEKQYLRLTTLPDPSQIRPEHILKKSLNILKEKWKNKISDYNYINEQFRSIRQDMTIQNINNEFTVKVYETHARIALESHDLDQFNQCQTKLIDLYKLNLPGKEIEFLAYRLIYMSLQGIRYDIEDILKMIKKRNLLKNIEISHAFKVNLALNDYNYFEFFKLYKIAPNMGSYLIEPFLSKLRIKSLHMIAVGYFTEINLSFIYDKLAFIDLNEFTKFLNEQNIILSSDQSKMLCKDSIIPIKENQLIISKHMTSNI